MVGAAAWRLATGYVMDSRKPKVFLIVNINTHLRVLMDTADLLHASGRYAPALVYYPSAVFDQNVAGCQQALHDAFIWTGKNFLSKADYLANDWRSDLSKQQRFRNKGYLRWVPFKKQYKALTKIFTFLPAPSKLHSAARRVFLVILPALQFVAGIIRILRSTLIFATSCSKSAMLRKRSRGTLVKRGWQQRLLLRMFEIRWHFAPKAGKQFANGFCRRLMILLHEMPFRGVIDQKIFYEGISKLIECTNPALIILPEANLFYNSQFIIRAAHLNAASVAIVPFTIVNTLEWAEAFYDIKRYQGDKGLNRLIAHAFPRWVLTHRGRRLILPAAYVVGCELFDMAPDVPWLINSGHADVIAAESQFMADYYQRAGIQKEKIHFTGALSDDKLFSLLQTREQARSLLRERHSISTKERIILIGLPPDQFRAGKRKGCEFERYDDLIRFMVETVVSSSGDHATVLINLHPRIQRSTVSWLESLGATIIDDPIDDLVPLADLYIAVASATIRLGISCGIPVLNYDAYNYGYDDYKDLGGVCEVKSKRDYMTLVESLIQDQSFYSKIQNMQKMTASRQCLIDGNAGERMLNLFDQIACTKAVACEKKIVA